MDVVHVRSDSCSIQMHGFTYYAVGHKKKEQMYSEITIESSGIPKDYIINDLNSTILGIRMP